MSGRKLARSVSALALSVGCLLAVPITAGAAPQPNADQVGLIVRDGIPVAVNITTAGQDARFTFSSVTGQKVSAYLSASTFGAPCGTVRLSLLRPNGTAFGTSVGSCNQTAFLDSQTLDASGSWTVLVDPQGTRVGTANLQAFNTNDEVGLVHLDGSAFGVVTTKPGENGRYKFPGTTGQKVSALISAATFTGCPAYAVSLMRPDGTAFGPVVTSCNDTAFLDAQTLDQTGVWSFIVNPQAMTTGTATLPARTTRATSSVPSP